MKFFYFVILLGTFLPGNALGQTAYDKLPRVLESGVYEELTDYAAANPNANTAEMIAFANRRFAERGYDFLVDPCDMKSTPTEIEYLSEHGGDVFHVYRATSIAGKPLRFMARQPGDAPCGCWLSLPVRSISSKQLTLVAKGTNDLVIRPPKDFLFEKAELVDGKLRKTIRTWITPHGGGPPDAISADGTKIYMEVEGTPISLEISLDGSLRFVASKSPGVIRTYRDLKNFRKDPLNGYLGYRRFTSGKESYTIKFSHVCT